MTRVNFKNRVGANLSVRTMADFSIRVFVMAIAISFAVVSCGKDDKNDEDDGDDGKVEATALTAANWQKIIKDVYGFDLTVSTGWSFNEGDKQTTAPSYYVKFTTTAADFKTEYSTFMQHVFDLTKAITPAKGNYDETGKKLDAIPTMMGEPFPLWLFDTSKYTVQLDITAAETTKTVQIYLVALKKL